MKKIRPSIIGAGVAIAITAIAGGLWAIGCKHVIGIVLWPGMMLGWMLVFGDNIGSFDEVIGVITLISIGTNGVLGFVVGALTGGAMKFTRNRKQTRRGEQQSGEVF